MQQQGHMFNGVSPLRFDMDGARFGGEQGASAPSVSSKWRPPQLDLPASSMTLPSTSAHGARVSFVEISHGHGTESPSAPAVVRGAGFDLSPGSSSSSSWLSWLRELRHGTTLDGRFSHRATAELRHWEIPSLAIEWYDRSRELGRGSFGVVYEVMIKSRGGVRAAAKRFEIASVSRGREQMVEMLRREFRAMARVDHPNLVKILGVVIDDPTYSCLLMEYAGRGSLRELLDDEATAIVGQPAVQLGITHDIASGMEYLHARTPVPMLHHDLKSRNVLLFRSLAAVASMKTLTAKIGDFGLTTGISRTTYGENTTTRVGGGTLAYKAPESACDAIPTRVHAPPPFSPTRHRQYACVRACALQRFATNTRPSPRCMPLL